MEDSSEGVSEENRVSPEKNVKRTLKTPAQLAALEEFYGEHKYPTEELKLEVGERIGLTEKQISSWFCHRRLKDKKKVEVNAGGKAERSGSIIQDRASGLRQDSCGSTKPGDVKTGDLKEVESDRLYRHEYHSADVNYDHGRSYPGNADDSSPQSSTSLHEKSVSPREDPFIMESRMFKRKNSGFTKLISKSSNGVPFKPSGYLKVRGDVENAAVTAVKRQLGSYYREDGPLLGVDFEPLPPGAFASQSRFPTTGPFYAGDLMRVQSPDFQGARKHSFLNMNCEVYPLKMMPEDPYHEGENSNTPLETDSHEQPEQVRVYNNCQYNKKSKLEVGENNCRGSVLSHGKRKISSSSELKETFRTNSSPNNYGFNGQKLKGDEMESQLDDHTADNLSTVKRNKSVLKPSNEPSASNEPSSFSKIVKNKKRQGQGKLKEAKRKPEAAKEEKQRRMNFPRQEVIKKDSVEDISGKTLAVRGSAIEGGSSSFSDVETAETSYSDE